MKNDELVAICKERHIRGYSGKKKTELIILIEDAERENVSGGHIVKSGPRCSVCRREGHNSTKKKPCTLEPLAPVDPVTPDALRKRYILFLNFEKAQIALDKEYEYTTRRNGLPEHISENIIKNIIQNYLGDLSCSWGCLVGDLYSNKYFVIECKSFTSDGPTSFGPNQKWNTIYFLDAREWLMDRFVLWEIPLPNTHEIWKNIKVNKGKSARGGKGKTKDEQGEEGRRPRINWERLYPQIQEHCTKVYDGTFEGIFIPPEAKGQSCQQ